MVSTNIQIMSDLHLEAPAGYGVFSITAKAPYLALLGDIGNTRDPGYFSFITTQLLHFKLVFLLLGNHEPYHSSWSSSKQLLKDFESTCLAAHTADPSKGRFIFLDQTRYDISDNVVVLGCTLHSRVLPFQTENVSFGLNDFYHIENWTVELHNAAHESDLAWLNSTVRSISETEPSRKILILTHHSPTVDARASDPVHAGSKLASGFATDLSGEDCWKNEQVRVWAFGHTHWNCDFSSRVAGRESGKRVVTDQRGYYFAQAKGYEGGKVVDM